MSRLVACDECYPGVLRRYLTASHLRRQGIALILSRLDPQRPHDLAERLHSLAEAHKWESRPPLEFVSHIMLHRRVQDIVRALFPDAQGLTGILGKLGSDPLSMRDYQTLIELLTRPEHRARAVVLRHLPKIPENAIQSIQVLPAHYVCLALLNRIRSLEQAFDFARSVELIKRVNPSVMDDDLRISLEASRPGTSLRTWIRRWLEKATEFWVPPPTVDETDMIVLRSAAAMRDAAKRFQNCLEGKIAECSLGRMIYIENRSPACLIEIECLSNGWAYKAVHGERNTSVEPATTRLVLQKLNAAGVQIPARHWQAVRYNRVARLARVLDPFRDNADLIDDTLGDPDQEIFHAA
jgi:hypothetical protein